MSELSSFILNKLHVGIIVVDENFTILSWNDCLVHITGKKREEVLQQKLSDICPRFAVPMYQTMLLDALHHGQCRFCSGILHQPFIAETPERHIDNRQNLYIEPGALDGKKVILLQITDITNHYNRVCSLKTMIKGLKVDYEAAKSSQEVMKQQAFYDVLTGLPNRILFQDRLSHAICQAERNQQIMALMFLDLDGFKTVNDQYGHNIGDQLLQAVADRISHNIRKSDTLARLGGDEFTAILPQIKQSDDVVIVAKKIIHAFDQPFLINNERIFVTVSIGISMYPLHGRQPEELVKKADSAMYFIKANGKNGYMVCNQSLTREEH